MYISWRKTITNKKKTRGVSHKQFLKNFFGVSLCESYLCNKYEDGCRSLNTLFNHMIDSNDKLEILCWLYSLFWSYLLIFFLFIFALWLGLSKEGNQVKTHEIRLHIVIANIAAWVLYWKRFCYSQESLCLFCPKSIRPFYQLSFVEIFRAYLC